MAICNMHKKFGKDRACGFVDMLAGRQTDTHTDMLITILHYRSRGRSNKYASIQVYKNLTGIVLSRLPESEQ